MPTYQYEALDATGKPQRGAVDATSSEEAIQQIRGQGFFPTSVREQKAKEKSLATATDAKPKKKSFLSMDFSFGKKKAGVSGAKKKKGGFSLSIGGVNRKNLTLFTRQLSTLQDAGLPLLRAIRLQRCGHLQTTVVGDHSISVRGRWHLDAALDVHTADVPRGVQGAAHRHVVCRTVHVVEHPCDGANEIRGSSRKRDGVRSVAHRLQRRW